MSADHDKRLREYGSPIERDGTASDVEDDKPAQPELFDIFAWLVMGLAFAVYLYCGWVA